MQKSITLITMTARLIEVLNREPLVAVPLHAFR